MSHSAGVLSDNVILQLVIMDRHKPDFQWLATT